jgi:hypothetical protein
VRDGETGSLFREQTVEGLVAAMQAAEAQQFDPHILRQNALAFSTAQFKARLMESIQSKLP